jgi:hypothetical protein
MDTEGWSIQGVDSLSIPEAEWQTGWYNLKSRRDREGTNSNHEMYEGFPG